MRAVSYLLTFALALALTACGSREIPKPETVQQFADALRSAGLGHTSANLPSSTDLSNFQAVEGLVLEGRDLLVEIYLFDSQSKLQLARTAISTGSNSGTGDGDVGVLAWGDFLIVIREEPSGGAVRRALEIVERGG